eukprot:CAMPEP_0179317718 /NCGR_PEP_ID=MMETSP0797-20121207/56443_1 /TAXON_ID=47934 /ORGANISM="Dinophysis acuminata, Strain DAEP01" /LENGTH=34 /DNA_ID= /DNA_START= /DNA_END= /DNA_ORIENTATION=
MRYLGTRGNVWHSRAPAPNGAPASLAGWARPPPD